jgi:hypothetical protein
MVQWLGHVNTFMNFYVEYHKREGFLTSWGADTSLKM